MLDIGYLKGIKGITNKKERITPKNEGKQTKNFF
jgi:hypothetical protein